MNSVFMSIVAYYQQQHRFGLVGLLQPVSNLLVLAVVAVWIDGHAELDMPAISGIYVTIAVILMILSVAHALWLVRGMTSEPPISVTEGQKYLKNTGGLLVAKTLSLVSLRLDVFFLGTLITYQEMGLYGAAIRMSVLVSMFTAVITTLVLPRAPEAMKSPIRFRRYLILAAFLSGLQAIVGVVVIVESLPIITLFFGDEYGAATLVTRLLVAQALFTAAGAPFQALIQTGLSSKVAIAIAAARMLITIPLLLYIVPVYRIEGAAFVVALVAFMLTLTQFVFVWRARPRMVPRECES
jgi:PST family polysaccharide transporter